MEPAHSESAARRIHNRIQNRTDGLLGPFSPALDELPGWRVYINQILSAQISTVTRYYDRLIQLSPRNEDSGLLLSMADCPEKVVVSENEELPNLQLERSHRTAILLNGNLNHDLDIQQTLDLLWKKCSRTTRLIAIVYNPYFRWLYQMANRLGLRKGEQPTTFVTRTDLENLCRLSGFEVIKLRPLVHLPFRLFGVGSLLNRLLPAVPLFRWLSLTTMVVLRPVKQSPTVPSLSVIIPARNERGNIEAAIRRLPDLGTRELEIIFVEGHSSDGTWQEIQRVRQCYGDRYVMKAFQQTGKGKVDAVRLGFSKASHELLIILDADLTMPPELLPRFIEAYRMGWGDFINGHRLLYPMESCAMRPLNWLGNVFFAKTLSAVLETRLGDSLCGTKAVLRSDYERMVQWRKDFNDFDPFGDFELLFPASILALGIVEIPIRYRDRTYGSTQIRRFSDGLKLLKMTVIGFFRVKIGPPL